MARATRPSTSPAAGGCRRPAGDRPPGSRLGGRSGTVGSFGLADADSFRRLCWTGPPRGYPNRAPYSGRFLVSFGSRPWQTHMTPIAKPWSSSSTPSGRQSTRTGRQPIGLGPKRGSMRPRGGRRTGLSEAAHRVCPGDHGHPGRPRAGECDLSRDDHSAFICRATHRPLLRHCLRKRHSGRVGAVAAAGAQRALIITDAAIASSHAAAVAASLAAAGLDHHTFRCPPARPRSPWPGSGGCGTKWPGWRSIGNPCRGCRGAEWSVIWPDSPQPPLPAGFRSGRWPRPSWPKSTAGSAAKPGSTWPGAKTWWEPSGSRGVYRRHRNPRNPA